MDSTRPRPRRPRAPRPRHLVMGGTVLVLLLFALPAVSATAPATAGAATPAIRPAGPSFGPHCGTGGFPSFAAYDPVNHWMYVPNQVSGNISVLSTPCKITATISLPSGADPVAAAYSPANNDIYVVDGGTLSQVYVIAKTTVIATINGGHFSFPTAIAWDPGDSIMLVANFGWANVTAIAATHYAGTIATGVQPDAIAYDPFFSTILIDCYGSLNITILPSAVYPFLPVHNSTTYGGGGQQIAYDPADDLDYVAGFSLSPGKVVLIDGEGAYVGAVKVGSGPIAVAFDQATLTVFVADRYGQAVESLNGTHVVTKWGFPKGTELLGLCYDDYDSSMYVTVTTPGSRIVEL